MIDINKQIEDTREKLNILIATKTIITGDKELLTLSVRLDKLINKYIHTKNSDVKWSSNYRATMIEMIGSGAQSNDNKIKVNE